MWLNSSMVLNKDLFCKLPFILRSEWPITWPISSLCFSVQNFKQLLAPPSRAPPPFPVGAHLILGLKSSKIVGNLVTGYLYIGCSGR